jgi:hypothetical protein
LSHYVHSLYHRNYSIKARIGTTARFAANRESSGFSAFGDIISPSRAYHAYALETLMKAPMISDMTLPPHWAIGDTLPEKFPFTGVSVFVVSGHA